jgi:hypothetical protein
MKMLASFPEIFLPLSDLYQYIFYSCLYATLATGGRLIKGHISLTRVHREAFLRLALSLRFSFHLFTIFFSHVT